MNMLVFLVIYFLWFMVYLWWFVLVFLGSKSNVISWGFEKMFWKFMGRVGNYFWGWILLEKSCLEVVKGKNKNKNKNKDHIW